MAIIPVEAWHDAQTAWLDLPSDKTISLSGNRWLTVVVLDSPDGVFRVFEVIH